MPDIPSSAVSAPASTSTTSSTSTPSTLSSTPTTTPASPTPTSSTPKVGHFSAEGKPGTEGRGVSAESPNETKAAAEARKFKVKIDDQDIDVDEAELVKGYQRARAANQRFEEAAKLRKQSEQFLNALKADPFKMLAHPALGVNAREIAEKFLLEQMEAEMVTPEERERRTMQDELRRYREAEAEQKRQRDEVRQSELKQRYAQEYTKKFTDALERSNLPKTEFTIQRMAKYMQESMKKGYEPDLSDVAELVREDYMAEQRAMFGSLDGDRLIQVLGEDTAAKIRRADLARVANPLTPQPTVVQTANAQKDEPKKMRPDEWREYIRKKAGL